MSLIKKIGIPLLFFDAGIALAWGYYEANKDRLTPNIKSAITVVVEPGNNTINRFSQIEDSYVLVYGSHLENHDWKFMISAEEYFKFKQKSHRHNTIEEFARFVTYDHKNIKQIAESVTKFSNSPEEKARVILDFVHQMVYDKTIEDKGMPDYVRYPLETLVERNGDCEDLTILAASLMKAVGINVALIHIPALPSEDAGHLALGVNGDFSGSAYTVDKKRFFYTETTGTQWLSSTSTWKIGQIPDDYKDRQANILIIP
ncbi:transglutaminase domain-containing protein [archaeon]|nr:transglutaminase domain-containing protein [archaeon]